MQNGLKLHVSSCKKSQSANFRVFCLIVTATELVNFNFWAVLRLQIVLSSFFFWKNTPKKHLTRSRLWSSKLNLLRAGFRALLLFKHFHFARANLLFCRKFYLSFEPVKNYLWEISCFFEQAPIFKNWQFRNYSNSSETCYAAYLNKQRNIYR